MKSEISKNNPYVSEEPSPISLYDKTGDILIGYLDNIERAKVIEERNGEFKLEFTYIIGSKYQESIVEGNLLQCKANDRFLHQRFRIYATRKLMTNRIEVFARHISYDLANDFIEKLNIINQSCEYCLNQIFRNSQFSTHYQGYSDIINAQDYNVSLVNALEAIMGTRGSIIDTFGTGPEILRDNTKIHVLERRGHDNGVEIAYSKNMTDMTVDEDRTDLITRIYAYAKVRDGEGNESIITAPGKFVDSPNIGLYSHPYIRSIDFSDKFDEKNPATPSKVQAAAEKYFRDNRCDFPRMTYKLNFVPLSKTTEGSVTSDDIELCDIVNVIDTRYNIKTKAKAIRVVYNLMTDRYDSIELGEPRSTNLGITGDAAQGPPGPPGPQGPPGADGDIGDFPDSLPNPPVITAKVMGFASIDLSWTYEDKVYYSYELYASKTNNFTPTAFDLIHEGQTSSFLYQVKPGETWYFRACAKNSHNRRTEFSPQVEVVTRKADNMENYFTNAAIGNAVVGSLTADYMQAGIIKGNWIDGRNLSVTDGTGKRTFDINSYGRVVLQPSSMKVLIDDKVEFLSSEGVRNMALYGGQMCAFNSTNNSFLSTAGAIIAPNFNIKGSGFLMSKHCNHFLIGRDGEWDDIYANRAPKPTYYFDMDFDNFQIKMGLPLLTSDVNLRGNSLYDASVGYIKDWYGFGWRLHSDGHQLMYASGHRIKFNVPVSFDGNELMNPTLYTDRYYFTNGHLVFQQSPGTVNVVSNGSHWDFNGMDLVNARIVGSFVGLDVINNPVKTRSLSQGKSAFDEIEIVEPLSRASDGIGKIDVSNVSDKASIMLDINSVDHGKMITMLLKEVKDLKARVNELEASKA